jgi:signal transduction histidine kinase
MAGVEVGLLMLVGALLWLAHREVARGLNRVAVMAAEVRAMNDRQALASFVLGPHPHDELDQLKETFNQLFERVEATGSIQRRFLADAAHELRAPLSGLLYQLRLIVRRGAARPDSIATWAHTAMAEADRLHRLVDDMLDLTTIEAGVAPLRPTRLDLTALCREEVARQRERHARLQWAGMDDAVWIEADPDRVRQVLHNLLTNALRATETQGTVVVEVRSGLGHGELVVRDTGVGMTEDVRANMFNRFYRGERTGRDGVGIGLAIVAEILRQHDASISVESRPWQGTNAYVHWPDKLP